MLQRIKLNLFIQVNEKILHKDAMKWKIEKYRLSGANIGENVRAFSPIVSPEAYFITIEDNVTISTGVKFCTHDNSAIKVFDEGTDFVGPIKIAKNCFIGMNTILMGGISLPENCIVGAGSVVTKSFKEEGCIIAGNPAKKIGTVNDLRKKNNLKVFNFKGMDYVEKKEEILKNQEKWIKK